MNSDQNQNTEYKKTLLARLLDGVKGCQSRFGSRSELATEDEGAVARLCAAYEDVFSHGFKKAAQQSSTSKTAFWVPAVLRSSDDASFWPLVKSQLSKHEAERFLLLHNVRTDAGRTRAWIRASLNEHSLERYILIILSLDNIQDFYEPWAFLRDHELNAILPQTAAGLGSVFFALTVDNPKLDSLAHVMEKDIPEATSVLEAQDSIEVADQAILALSPSSVAQKAVPTALSNPPGKVFVAGEEKSKIKVCKKKKKKPPVNFVSFDDDEPTGSLDSVNVSTSSVYSSLPATAGNTPTEKKSHSFHKENSEKDNSSCNQRTEKSSVLSTSNVNMESSMLENKERELNSEGRRTTPEALSVKDSENESSEPSVSVDVPVISKPSQSIGDTGMGGADPSICSTSVKSVDCISVNSVYSDCSERLDLECVSLAGLEIPTSQRLKPIVNESSGGSGRGSSSDNPDFSHDLIPVPSYDSSVAHDLHLDVEPQCGLSSSSKISPVTPTTPGRSGGSTSGASRKNSLSSLANSTADFSAQTDEGVRKLKAILDREIETVASLRGDLAEEKRHSSNQIKMLEAKIESLSKENEILRHQLQKYVGAVQLLKREGSRRMSMDDNDDSVVNNCDHQPEIGDSSHEAEYERKLIQVAEMHGELMEFNSHLQKTIQRKDAALKRLKKELIDLRGPLAAPFLGGEDEEDDDSWDIVESFSSAENSRGRSTSNAARRLAGSHQSNERVLINIWIPSAFLTGATNDLHHVYQLRWIKDCEWNIYRRYSQFYSLHRELSKNDPGMTVISSLYFPPKKHLGNKDAKFVDERRRKLQEYLRAVVNHTLQSNSILASHPEKNLLISILPFFGESFNAQPPKPKRERSRTRNLFFRQSGQSAQPTGPTPQLQFSTYPQYTGL